MRTIKKSMLYTSGDEQSFKLPGWGGVAFITPEDGFANAFAIYNHIDIEKDEYMARFRVIPEGFPNPKGTEFVYVGGVVVAQLVYFVWRNAVSEKV